MIAMSTPIQMMSATPTEGATGHAPVQRRQMAKPCRNRVEPEHGEQDDARNQVGTERGTGQPIRRKAEGRTRRVEDSSRPAHKSTDGLKQDHPAEKPNGVRSGPRRRTTSAVARLPLSHRRTAVRRW